MSPGTDPDRRREPPGPSLTARTLRVVVPVLLVGWALTSLVAVIWEKRTRARLTAFAASDAEARAGSLLVRLGVRRVDSLRDVAQRAEESIARATARASAVLRTRERLAGPGEVLARRRDGLLASVSGEGGVIVPVDGVPLDLALEDLAAFRAVEGPIREILGDDAGALVFDLRSSRGAFRRIGGPLPPAGSARLSPARFPGPGEGEPAAGSGNRRGWSALAEEDGRSAAVLRVALTAASGQTVRLEASLDLQSYLERRSDAGRSPGVREVVFAPDGTELVRLPDGSPGRLDLAEAAVLRSVAPGESSRRVALPTGPALVESRQVGRAGWIWVGVVPTAALDSAARGAAVAALSEVERGDRWLRAIGLVQAAVVAAVVGLLLSRFLRPLGRAAAFADSLVAGSSCPTRTAVGTDEVARVVRALEDLDVRLRRRMRLTEGGHRLARASALMTKPEETFRALPEEIAGLVGAKRSIFLLFDAATSSLRPQGPGHGFDTGGLAGFRIGWDDHSLAMLSFRSGETFVSNDLRHDPKSSGPLAEGAGIEKSAVLSPLRTEAGPLGVLLVADKPGGFDGDDRASVEGWADIAALLIRNARLYEELQAAYERLQRAIRGREHFLQDVNHELRTPLTAIVGWAEVLAEDEPDDETSTAAIEQIRRSAEHLVTLVSDLLDLARLEEGGAQVDRVEADLGSLVRAALAPLAVLAVARGVSLSSDAPGEGEASVRLDPARTRQVLWNLVHNALKFTPRGGGVVVRARLEGTAAVFEVSDDGPGIPAQEQALVFERYRQADAGRATPQRGSGIGLSLARGFVEAHGGTIRVESAPGRGATFVVRIPRGEAISAASV